VFLFMVEIGFRQKAFPTALCFAVIVIAARARWDLRSHTWFWIIIFAVSVMHLAAIFTFNLPSNVHPVSILMPFLAVDFIFIIAIIFLAERIFLPPDRD